MEANELRIGDRIDYIGPTIVNVGILAEIQRDGVKTYAKGIPLTEEILLKCGANKLSGHEELNDHIHFALNGSTALFICIDDGRGYPNDGKALYLVDGAPMGSFLCKYLHQLQNLYFALTNKELQWQ